MTQNEKLCLWHKNKEYYLFKNLSNRKSSKIIQKFQLQSFLKKNEHLFLNLYSSFITEIKLEKYISGRVRKKLFHAFS